MVVYLEPVETKPQAVFKKKHFNFISSFLLCICSHRMVLGEGLRFKSHQENSTLFQNVAQGAVYSLFGI